MSDSHTPSVSPVTRARIEMQGYVGFTDRELARLRPWLRLAPASVAICSLVATIVGSALPFLALVPLFVAGTVLPNHPFDAVGNRLRGREAVRVPRTPPQRRFSYAFASMAMLVAAALYAVSPVAARLLGGAMAVMAGGTAVSLFCLPAWLWERAGSIVRRS